MITKQQRKALLFIGRVVESKIAISVQAPRARLAGVALSGVAPDYNPAEHSSRASARAERCLDRFCYELRMGATVDGDLDERGRGIPLAQVRGDNPGKMRGAIYDAARQALRN